LKVLVIGDTHYDNVVKGYLEAQLEATWKIITSSMPQAVIFLGDIFHYRNPDVETFLKVHKFFTCKLNQIPGLSKVIILRGNHDSANKSDDGLTVLQSFQHPGSKVRLIQFSDLDLDLNFAFIPHYEKEEIIKEDLAGLSKHCSGSFFLRNPLVFGHFGYEGSIYTNGFFNFTLKKEELKYRTILGHIHKFKDDGNVTILGTPWSTNQGEGDYPHYVAELERSENGNWGELNLIEVNHGPRHLTLPFQSLESLKEDISNPAYFTILRVLVDKFTDDATNDLKNQILKEYKVAHVELKFQPILDKKLNNRLSNYAPTTKIETLSNDVLDSYLDEQSSNIPREDLMKGLEEIKMHGNQETNG
jgi:hypothetical protein